ncbi:heme ABC transporter ATP-binding protein [Sporichthya brevicatena]|uniref:Heme ABC transporter ATP-binding protein n=1 Tax=Sporichthya brevicatena TaxID=171442 RepID=A0ABN1GXT9_9ACTN
MKTTTLTQRELRLPAPKAPGDIVAEARDVCVTLGGAAILRNVDLQIRAGRVLALVGPNGAGKSTLLGAISGDLEPTSGTVSIDGASPSAWTWRELAIRRGVLMQRVDVTFPFAVTEVVRMGRSPWAGTPAEDWDDEVVADAMAEADVTKFTDRVFNSLSGGERARAAMARVLAQEAGLLLLDEPTAAMDIKHQELVLHLARGRARRGDAVVVVMHDLALAAAYADEIAVMSRGQIAAVGHPVTVLTPELLTRVYEHPIEVLRHPRTGAVVVLPRRDFSVVPTAPSQRSY